MALWCMLWAVLFLPAMSHNATVVSHATDEVLRDLLSATGQGKKPKFMITLPGEKTDAPADTRALIADTFPSSAACLATLVSLHLKLLFQVNQGSAGNLDTKI